MSDYAEQILDGLKSEAEKRSLKFLPETPTELSWILNTLSVRPRNRTWYGVEGDRNILLGIIFVPEPEREWSDRAWNRIDEPYRTQLIQLEDRGWKEKRIKLTFVQVWENERRAVIIPFQTLKKVATFTTKGNFTVRKDGVMFSLVTPKGEDNIDLSTSLSELFHPF